MFNSEPRPAAGQSDHPAGPAHDESQRANNILSDDWLKDVQEFGKTCLTLAATQRRLETDREFQEDFVDLLIVKAAGAMIPKQAAIKPAGDDAV